MMRQPSRLFLVAVLLLLGGCASFRPLPRPQDFPFRSTDDPFFNLYWRLDRREGAVTATGLVEAARQGDFSAVYLELRGLDKEGQVVSHGLGRTWPGELDRFQTIPFSVTLRPTGREDRFVLSVWSYDWAEDQGGKD